MSDEKNGAAGEVKVARHRPERLGDFAVVGSICCSSCCCCCCVHSAGGVAGALVGSAVAASAPGATSNVTDDERAASNHVIGVYWAALIAITTIIIAISVLTHDLITGVFIILFGGPFIQLGVSLLALPAAFTKTGAARQSGLRALGRITLIGFVGSVIGGVIMLGGGAVLLGLFN